MRCSLHNNNVVWLVGLDIAVIFLDIFSFLAFFFKLLQRKIEVLDVNVHLLRFKGMFIGSLGSILKIYAIYLVIGRLISSKKHSLTLYGRHNY